MGSTDNKGSFLNSNNNYCEWLKLTQFQIVIDKLRYINQDLPNQVYERELYEIKIENDKKIIPVIFT